MSFGSNYQKVLTVHNEVFLQNTCCRYLGVYIDPKSTFRDLSIDVLKETCIFCSLIYKFWDIYQIKCLLSFYNAYGRSVICYGLLIHGSAARTNLEMAHRRNIRAILFKNKYDSIQDTALQFTRYHIELNTVFELFFVDVFREIFNQLRSNGTTKFSKLGLEKKHQKREDRNQRIELVAENEPNTC